MKKLPFLIVSLLGALSLSAQYPLAKGQSQLNAGFGFSNRGLPVYLGFDVGVHRDVSIGGEFSFRNYHHHWHDDRHNHNILGLALNANYHFNTVFGIPPDEWDVYAGGGVGFYYWTAHHNDHDDVYASGLGPFLQVGARYYFSSRAGINIEFGGGRGTASSGGKIGITIKF